MLWKVFNGGGVGGLDGFHVGRKLCWESFQIAEDMIWILSKLRINLNLLSKWGGNGIRQVS